MPVYNRKYELLVGSPPRDVPISRGILRARELDEGLRPGGYSDYRTEPAGTDFIASVTGLHFTASVTYTVENDNNSGQMADIRIYNMKKESQNLFQSGGVVFLKAGYEQNIPFSEVNREDNVEQERSATSDLPNIFNGQIEYVFSEKEGQDTITTMVCRDLGWPLKNVRFTRGYPPGVTVEQVIRDMLAFAASRGMPTGGFFIPEFRGEGWDVGMESLYRSMEGGYSISGNLIEELMNLCSSIGFRCYIVAGAIYIESKFADRSRVEVVVIEQRNIKGSIRRYEDSSGQAEGSEEIDSGVQLNTFLNGNITPNKLLRLDADSDYDGTYLIKEVEHVMEYEGSNWDTVVTATRILT